MTGSGLALPQAQTGEAHPGDDRVVSVAPPSLSTVARGLSWTVIERLVGQGSWYASLLVLAILVPPRAFGVVAVGSVIVSVATLLMESGTGGTIVVTPEVSASHLRRSVARTGSAGVALSAIAAALAAPILHAFAHGGDANALRAMFAAVGVGAFAIVPQALLKKTLHFKRQALVLIVAAILASAAGITAGALGAGVWALVTRLVVYQVLLAVLSWVVVLDLLPRGGGSGPPPPLRRAGAPWFMTIALAAFVAWGVDNLIVGHFTNTAQLGMYTMAFSLGLAPTMQISWQVGLVLFPAIAATRDRVQVAQRTLKSMRLMALLLLPLVPLAIVLAPTIIPSVLGHKWAGVVVPFQLLIVVGAVQGIINMLGESLGACGGIGTRGRIDATWAALTGAALIVGAKTGGIRGAAIAHLVMNAFLATAYLRWGAPRVGLSASDVVKGVRGAGLAVAAQGAVTLAAVISMRSIGTGSTLAALTAGLLGIAALALALPRTAPGLASEARSVVAAAVRGRSV